MTNNSTNNNDELPTQPAGDDSINNSPVDHIEPLEPLPQPVQLDKPEAPVASKSKKWPILMGLLVVFLLIGIGLWLANRPKNRPVTGHGGS